MAKEALATVTSISGRAQARNTDGELRELRVGDELRAGETVVTPDGGTVALSLSDGSPLTVDGVAEMAITPDLVAETAAGADESAVEDETVQQVLVALESGEDLGDILPPTAAGSEAASGLEGEGHSWVRLGRILLDTDEFTGIAGSAAQEAEAVLDENLIPVDAVDDAATTEEGVPVIIDVQSNDDFQLGSNVIGVTDGARGTVVINADNTVTYTPEPGFFGTDSFTYTALSADGNGQDTANVTVVVEEEPSVPPPPPPPIPEDPPTILINDDIVVEGETATLTISLSKPWTETVTVQYKTTDDTAVAPGDYDPVTGLVTVTFAPGETSIEVTFSTNEDNLEELREQFLVNLSNPTNATIADDTGIIEIKDDFKPPSPPPPPPPPPGPLSIEPGESVLDEGNLPGGSAVTVLPVPDGIAALSVASLAADEGDLPSKTGSFTVVAGDGLGTLSITADQAFYDGGTPGHGPAETADDLAQTGGTALVFDFENGGFQPGMYIIEEGVVKITFDSISGPGEPGKDGILNGTGEYTIFVTTTLLGPLEHETGGATDDQITLQVTVDLSDEDGDSASATYTAVVLDDEPIANNDGIYDVDEDSDFADNVFNVFSNDIPGADGVNLVTGVAVETGALHGDLQYNNDGTFSYRPDADYYGPDSFTYTLTDADGDVSTATANINVVNIAEIEALPDIASITEGGSVQARSDVVLILDDSGSMQGSELANLKAAVTELFNSGSVNSVFIVTFGSTAQFVDSGENNGWFTDQGAALAEINSLSGSSGNTNYDDAYTAVIDNWHPGGPPAGGDKLVSVFISDGEPNRPSFAELGLDNADEAEWLAFLNTNGFDDAFAIGFSGIDESNANELEPLAATPGEEPDTHSTAAADSNVLVLEDVSGLSDALLSTIDIPVLTVDGNVLTNDITDADLLTLLSVSYGGDTHNFPADGVTANFDLDAGNGIFGTLSINQDGSYNYSIVDGLDIDVVQAAVVNYTMGDGSVSDASTLTLRAVPRQTVTSITDAAGVEGAMLVHTVTLSAAPEAAQVFRMSTSGEADLVDDYSLAAFSDGVIYDAGTGLMTVPEGVSAFTISVATLDDAVAEGPEDYQIKIDDTSATGTITDAPPAALALQASVEEASGTEPHVQTATAEADTLLATDEADVFVWSLADNTPTGDLIVGFDATADAINIADILVDSVDTTDFASYLDVSMSGDGVSTVIKVSNTGDFENAEQTITVQDVNLVAGVDLDDTAALATALQNLVDAGKLITE